MSYAPYQPPRFVADPRFDPQGSPPQPAVFLWYALYCACMFLMYLALAAGCSLLFVFAGELADEEMSSFELRAMTFIFGIISLPLALIYAAGPLLPRNTFGWIVGCINIGIGLTGGCTILPAVVLLIFWLKPETKRYYGMSG